MGCVKSNTPQKIAFCFEFEVGLILIAIIRLFISIIVDGKCIGQPSISEILAKGLMYNLKGSANSPGIFPTSICLMPELYYWMDLVVSICCFIGAVVPVERFDEEMRPVSFSTDSSNICNTLK